MNPHRRTQKLFFVTALLIAIGVLYLLFNAYFQQQNNPNQNPQTTLHGGVATVTLKPNVNHTYLVSGTLNNANVTFVIDTGASSVAISQQLADKLRLKRGAPVQLGTANGTVNGYTTRVDRIQIGNIVLRNIRAVMTHGMRGDTVLLGNSALKYLHITYKNQRMILQQEP